MKKSDLEEKRRRVAKIIEEFRKGEESFAKEPSTITTKADDLEIETANISRLVQELREEDSEDFSSA